MVEEPAAECVPAHRPAGRVHDAAGLGLVVWDLPELLDADRVGLWVLALGELEAVEELPAELAARAFGEDCVAAGELHAELELVLGFAPLADAHVPVATPRTEPSSA